MRRAHIDTLIAAAAAQQHQSELQVRVATWRQRIDPILQAEEDRSAFDIHHYGERIIDRLDNLKLGPHDAGGSKQQPQGQDGDGVVQFAEVVEAVDRFEVSRLFASMLQLINNRCAICESQATWTEALGKPVPTTRARASAGQGRASAGGAYVAAACAFPACRGPAIVTASARLVVTMIRPFFLTHCCLHHLCQERGHHQARPTGGALRAAAAVRRHATQEHGRPPALGRWWGEQRRHGAGCITGSGWRGEPAAAASGQACRQKGAQNQGGCGMKRLAEATITWAWLYKNVLLADIQRIASCLML